MGLVNWSISWILQVYAWILRKWVQTSDLYLRYSGYKPRYFGNWFGRPIYSITTTNVFRIYSKNLFNSNKTAKHFKKNVKFLP